MKFIRPFFGVVTCKVTSMDVLLSYLSSRIGGYDYSSPTILVKRLHINPTRDGLFFYEHDHQTVNRYYVHMFSVTDCMSVDMLSKKIKRTYKKHTTLNSHFTNFTMVICGYVHEEQVVSFHTLLTQFRIPLPHQLFGQVELVLKNSEFTSYEGTSWLFKEPACGIFFNDVRRLG